MGKLGHLKKHFFVFDRSLGLKFLGRPEGVLTSLAGELKRQRARKTSWKRDPIVVEQVDNSYYELPRFDTEIVEEVRSGIRQLLDSPDASTVEIDGVEAIRSVNSTEKDLMSEVDGLDKLLDQPQVVNALKSYFGSSYRISFINAMRYSHTPEKLKESADDTSIRDWHLDMANSTKSIHLIVYLTDETTEGASTHVVSRQDTVELLADEDINVLDRALNLDATFSLDPGTEKVNEFSGPPGSAMLFRSYTQLHRGGDPPEGKCREAIVFVLEPGR